MSREIEKRWILPSHGIKIHDFIGLESIKSLPHYSEGNCNTYFFYPKNSDIFTRIRLNNNNSNARYSICTKIGHGVNREEIECEISEEDFKSSIHDLTPIYFDYIEFESMYNLQIEIKQIYGIEHYFIIEVEFPTESFASNTKFVDLINFLKNQYKIEFNPKINFDELEDVTTNENWELINIYKSKFDEDNLERVYVKWNDESTLPPAGEFVLCKCVDLHLNTFFKYLECPEIDGHRGCYWLDKSGNVVCDDGCNCIYWIKIE